MAEEMLGRDWWVLRIAQVEHQVDGEFVPVQWTLRHTDGEAYEWP